MDSVSPRCWRQTDGITREIATCGHGVLVTGFAARGKTTVVEGDALTIGVSVRGTVAGGGDAATVTVTAALANLATLTDADIGVPYSNPEENADYVTGNLTLVFPFTANSGSTARTTTIDRTIHLSTNNDDDAENEAFMVSFTITGDTGTTTESPKKVLIDDDEPQTYTLTPAAGKKLIEGSTLAVTLQARPAHVDLGRNLMLHIDDPTYTVDVSRVGIRAEDDSGTSDITEAAKHTITITAPPNDKNRVMDTIKLSAVSEPNSTSFLGGKQEDMLELEVTDIHVLPMVSAMLTDKDGEALDPQPESVNEGDEIYLTLTAERPKPKTGEVAVSGEAITVTLMATGSAGSGDFRFVSTHPVTIVAAPSFGDQSTSKSKFKIEILDDPDVGAEMLVFDAVAKGSASNGSETSTSAGIVSVSIMDQTALNISPKSEADVKAAYMAAREEAAGDDELWTAAGEPDPAIMIELEDLFDLPMSGFNVSADAMSSDGMVVMADANSEMVTLTAMGDGEAMVTITATTTASSSVGTQVSANIATVELMVTVDKLPPVITVMTDPMDMVEEGGTITVTATLNQMAPYDKEVMLTVVGPVEGDGHMVTIMEGEMMGQAMLMVMDDDEVKPLSDIVIVAAHAAIEGGAVEMMLSVTENDAVTTYELSGPEDMNLVEGMEYEIMATASAAVMEDTEVMLMRDRAASDAGDDDYMVESIMIMAGETMGTTMLMVTEDDMPDGGTGTNMGEKLVLLGMVGNVQTNDLAFYLWDAAVPALPIIAQLLLAAFLAAGGYRRYLRR